MLNQNQNQNQNQKILVDLPITKQCFEAYVLVHFEQENEFPRGIGYSFETLFDLKSSTSWCHTIIHHTTENRKSETWEAELKCLAHNYRHKALLSRT